MLNVEFFLYRDTWRFFEVVGVERVGKGIRDKGKGDFSNGNDISKSCKK